MHFRESCTALDGLRFTHRIHEHPAPRFTPTLFVSGAFQTMDSWSRYVETFSAHTTVLLVDPPGMGGSDLLPPELGVDYLARCLARVLDERGIDRVSIVAASYGTPSAFHFALEQPHRIDRIALAGTMKALPDHLRDRIAGTVAMARRLDREALADECIDGMTCDDPSAPIDRRALARRVLRATIVGMSDAELLKYASNTERLLGHQPLDLRARIVGPEALVFTGEHDTFTYPAACREVASTFERVWFTTVRRADHLFPLQQARAVRELLLRFMSRTLGPEPAEGWHAVEPLESTTPSPAPPALVATPSL